jgi:hypothetical protein
MSKSKPSPPKNLSYNDFVSCVFSLDEINLVLTAVGENVSAAITDREKLRVEPNCLFQPCGHLRRTDKLSALSVALATDFLCLRHSLGQDADASDGHSTCGCQLPAGLGDLSSIRSALGRTVTVTPRSSLHAWRFSVPADWHCGPRMVSPTVFRPSPVSTSGRLATPNSMRTSSLPRTWRCQTTAGLW